MHSRLRTWALFTLLAVGVALARGQAPSCLTRKLPVVIQDSKGNPVAGFAPADLTGKFRGKPVEIVSVTVDDKPRKIVVLLDASGSMDDTGNGKWPIALRIIADLLDSARKEDSISLVIFSGRVDEMIDASYGRATILKRLREIAAGRESLPKYNKMTAIWDTLLYATSSPEKLGSNDVIYLVSDGDDNTSKMKKSKVRRRLLESGIRVFSLLLPNPPDFATEGSEDVTGLARETGGVSILISPKESLFADPVFALRKEELLGAERLLAAQLSLIARTYLVEIRLPVVVERFQSWKLSASESAGRWRKNSTFSYPSELVPCPSRPE